MEMESPANLTLFNVTNQTNSSFTSENIQANIRKPSLTKYYPILATELTLSILCSIILIIVYVIIKEHKTLPGKNVISISCCLIITYVLLIVDLLLRNVLPHEACVAIGITIHTTFLATFFWINVLSYDIMRTMTSIQTDLVKTSKFRHYFTYALIMTLVCVVPAVTVDHIDSIPNEYKPKFGIQKCWLSGQTAFLIYFNLPVGLTLATNCIFFGLTARTIVKVRNATTILAVNRQKKRFRLCIKLVLIMGLVWITEFIPWVTGIYFLYAIAGMLNCLHGVWLFIIFLCKRRTLKLLIASCDCLQPKISPTIEKKKTPSMDTVSTMVLDTVYR